MILGFLNLTGDADRKTKTFKHFCLKSDSLNHTSPQGLPWASASGGGADRWGSTVQMGQVQNQTKPISPRWETVFTCPGGQDGWSRPASPSGPSQHLLLWADPSPRTPGSRAQGPGFKGVLEMPKARTLPFSIPASRSPRFNKWVIPPTCPPQ